MATAKVSSRSRSRSASWPPSTVPAILPSANTANGIAISTSDRSIGRLQEGGEIDRRQAVADALGDAGAEQAQHLGRQRRAHRGPRAAAHVAGRAAADGDEQAEAGGKARPPTQTSQPRQPISEPTAAAIGTPTTRVSDWPLITQPSARPRWRSATRPETSAKTTPVKAPPQPPPTVAHTATQKKEPASACASTASARQTAPPTSSGRRPTTVGHPAAQRRGDAPRGRRQRHQVGDQRHADVEVVRHLEQERRARGAARGGGEGAEAGGADQGPRQGGGQDDGFALHRHPPAMPTCARSSRRRGSIAA